MKKLPIGIQSIKKILTNGNYIYADKTGLIKELIEADAPHYFMSRPRRFGKSLFLNALKEIFSGNRDLFKGCKIHKSNYSWPQHPVLYFDFSGIDNTTPEELIAGIKAVLMRIGKQHKISVAGPSVQFQLQVLVEELAKKNRVVVLVDEYDQPIINNLKKPDIVEQNRTIMKNFYGTLKSLDEYLRFTFVTGVSKFSQVSLFSGPNHLTDITMDPKYATMTGYTEEEVKTYFSEHIKAIAEKRGQTEDAVLEEIREWYNGYRFSEKEVSVYNPYSTLCYLSAGKAIGYWYNSGTPSFLIDQVKKHPPSIVPVRGSQATRAQLSDINRLDQIDLRALMFQTGYLTITNYNEKEDSFTLDFPNVEVRKAFFDSLFTEFVGIDPLVVSPMTEQVRKNLEEFDLESFVSIMNSHFAKISYQQFSDAHEGFYQAVLFTFLERSGISTQSEIATNIGRIDLIAELPKAICIFELKLDKTAATALQQAQTKKYMQKYLHSGKEILVVGLNFSSKSRNIESWKGEAYSSSGALIQETQSIEAIPVNFEMTEIFNRLLEEFIVEKAPLLRKLAEK